MSYITRKINKLDYFASVLITIIILTSFVFGHFFYTDNWMSVKFFTVTIFLVVFSMVLIVFIFKIENKVNNYQKGKEGEDYIENILKNIPNITYKRGIKIKNGDLDFLVEKNNKYFGLEAKNYSGKISYDEVNDLILLNEYDTNILNRVKSASAEVQKELNKTKPEVKFVQPVVVFCDHRACVNIQNNKITSKGLDVYVIGSSQLKEFFK